MSSRFVRVAEQDRRSIEIEVDGVRCTALEGDTLLVAVITPIGIRRWRPCRLLPDGRLSGLLDVDRQW
jgi:hypothetical protein